MKKTLLFLAAFVPVSLFAAAPPVREGSVSRVGTPTTVAVSSSAWTLVEPVAQMGGRTGVIITNDSSNASNIQAVFSSSTASALAAVTIKVMELAPGSPASLAYSDAIFLWAIYEGTTSATANVHFQEVSQ